MYESLFSTNSGINSANISSKVSYKHLRIHYELCIEKTGNEFLVELSFFSIVLNCSAFCDAYTV